MFMKKFETVRYEPKDISTTGSDQQDLAHDENKTKASLQQLANVRMHDHILIKEDQIILEEDLSLSEPSKLSTIVPDRQDPADDQDIPPEKHNHENDKNKFLSSNLSTIAYDQQDPVDDQDTVDDNLCHFSRDKDDLKRTILKGPFRRKGIFSVLGHCQYFDDKSIPPPGGGYLKAIDYYHHREGYEKRENCFLRCVKNLTHNEIDVKWLINSTKLGLPKVVQFLHNNFGLDPLFAPDEELNAV